MKNVLKKLSATIAAAAMLMFASVSASAEIQFGKENYREARSVYFRYEGEKPSGWKANVAGRLSSVAAKDDVTLYRFDYEAEVDHIVLKALNRNGQVIDYSKVELL